MHKSLLIPALYLNGTNYVDISSDNKNCPQESLGYYRELREGKLDEKIYTVKRTEPNVCEVRGSFDSASVNLSGALEINLFNSHTPDNNSFPILWRATTELSFLALVDFDLLENDRRIEPLSLAYNSILLGTGTFAKLKNGYSFVALIRVHPSDTFPDSYHVSVFWDHRQQKIVGSIDLLLNETGCSQLRLL